MNKVWIGQCKGCGCGMKAAVFMSAKAALKFILREHSTQTMSESAMEEEWTPTDLLELAEEFRNAMKVDDVRMIALAMRELHAALERPKLDPAWGEWKGKSGHVTLRVSEHSFVSEEKQ